MQQKFEAPIGAVTSDTVTIQHQHNGSVFVLNTGAGETEAANDEPLLVPAQRTALNALVRQLADASKQEPRQLWMDVHAELGVCSIKEITAGQFPVARDFLVRRIASEQETAACNTLIHTILKNADMKSARPAMFNHCLVSYGTKHLKSLEREQLQQLLGYIQTLPPSIPAAAPPKKMRKAICWQSFAGRVKKWLGR